MKAVLVGAAICLGGVVAAAAPETASAPAAPAAAAQAYERNIALGESLGGEPATPAQAEEAARLFQEALAGARARLAQEPRSAEAHRMVGMVLCTAYRPTTAPAGEAPAEGGGEPPREAVSILVQGGGKDCEEGLAELRAALHLEPTNPDYPLDYAEALAACHMPAACEEQALSLWERRPTMSNLQCARCARLLAGCAQRSDQAQAEIRWLREVVKYDPQDTEAARRLARLAAGQPQIVWMSYEDGKALAEAEQKPMLVTFETKWCGWCRRLEKNVFTQEVVVDCSREFACIQVDAEERRDLAAALKVDTFPTAVVLDHRGRELGRIVGYRPAKWYVAELRAALAAH